TRQIANGYQKALTPKASLSLFAEDSAEAMEDGQPGARWKALSKWYGEQEGWKDVAGRIRDASYGIYEEERLRREVAGTLYGDVLRGSISRLEQFASCPCSYFLRYGLSLQERPIASFKASDRGSLFHDAIRIFTNRVKELGKDFHSLSGDEVDSMADFSFEVAFSAAEESLPEQDASGKEGKESMKRVFRRTAQTVVMQVKAGAFEPAAAEMPFSLRLPLSEGRQMDLHGIVDRLDEAKAGEKTLLRIVDYKSSARKLELDSLYYGLSLQLFLYMQAALEKEQGRHPGQDFVPAGVFYYDMEDPLVPVSADEEAKSAEEKIIQQLRLSGLFKGTEEVVNAMDSTPALTKSRAVMLALKKDGSIDESKSSAVAEEDFDMLAGYSLEKAKQLGSGILE
ncbi:MAG: PD-(D/E)XK nuclease family protein, partial [Eggerthellaceae bacterium]|nr:PD-(D/E)XK nuclease family protein [Eggerthellaceae bacterium]